VLPVLLWGLEDIVQRSLGEFLQCVLEMVHTAVRQWWEGVNVCGWGVNEAGCFVPDGVEFLECCWSVVIAKCTVHPVNSSPYKNKYRLSIIRSIHNV